MPRGNPVPDRRVLRWDPRRARRPTRREVADVIEDLWDIPEYYCQGVRDEIMDAQDAVRAAADASLDEDPNDDLNVQDALFDLMMVQRHYARTLGDNPPGAYERPSAYINDDGLLMTQPVAPRLLLECGEREYHSEYADIVIAVKREPSRDIVPQWIVYLVDLVGTQPVVGHCKSYTVRAAGTARWERVSEPHDVNEPIEDSNRFSEYAVAGKLHISQFERFEELFDSIEIGPNNFFIVRWLAEILAQGIARNLTEGHIKALIAKANYSNVEFEGRRENGRCDGYLPWDRALMEHFGEDAISRWVEQSRRVRQARRREEREEHFLRGRSASPALQGPAGRN
ncbi:uncharacterized protein DSM5745_01579 [Aspergillus mulundensis]|uniref:Uncharacterized protein n=1 Tax=Aspergillus mulundensis TaxID=1810919 RepID=A0A3D8SU74_9EURO|nr:hypothetical protein DSM5745_01579 [Aspergillus mulundensis]RDW89804.1 hypothetical protein DSM5745_01579 [Aspergillus mulundensis]